jgi:hypothetical protein
MTGKIRKPSENSSNYDVGYGKPPEHARFKPGQGRRSTGKKDDIDVLALLNKPLPAKRGERVIKIHPYEAMLIGMSKRALQGQVRAIKALLQECDKAGLLKPLSSHDPVITVPKDVDSTIFCALLRRYGRPPWSEELYKTVEEEHRRDREKLDRLLEEAKKQYGQ